MSPHNAGSESAISTRRPSLQKRWLGRILLVAAVAVALTAMLLSNPNESSAATSIIGYWADRSKSRCTRCSAS